MAWRSGHGTRDWNLGVLRAPNAVVPPPPNRVHGLRVCIASGDPVWLRRGLVETGTFWFQATSSEGICPRVDRPWRAPTGSAEAS